jgi:sucrose-6-phosphate hydrolase SacC (GH32 family)
MKPSPLTFLCVLLLGAPFELTSARAATSDLLIADFEGETYGAWRVTGEAFGSQPARGSLPGQMAVSGFEGRGLVNSFNGGDRATGTLTSPPFKVERRYLRFLIGGGRHPGQTCVNLLLRDEVVRTADGPNDRPGGSEHLEGHEWDVGDLLGQSVSLQIVDQATGGWGHINADHFVQTDQPLPAWRIKPERRLLVQHRYLHLPVRTAAPKRVLSVLLEGQLQHEFEIELPDGEPGWWAFLDVSQWIGKELVLRADKLREDSGALELISQGDQLRNAADLYREALRPQFHFSSRRGWNNDPNGLVYYQGEYHLFYQHNPYGWAWGNMHWGHAVSHDLVHWQEIGEALYPDDMGTMFSGSAVIDWQDTAGFFKGDEKPMICFYTAAGGTSPRSQGQPFTQCIAYSLDRGRTWTKSPDNPVLPHVVGSNRDPKVVWHEPSRRWIMALYLDRNDFGLFSSSDLKNWEKLTQITIPETTECPDFFEIPIEGTPAEARWIIYGGNGRYLVGRFDGRTFTTESGPHAMQWGNCFYASQTFSDIPPEDGRRILIPWGTVALPGMPFNQMMGLPVELTLQRTTDGLRLSANPVRELAVLRTQTHRATPGPLTPGEDRPAPGAGELLEIEADITPGRATAIRLNVRGVPVTFDTRAQRLRCGDRTAPLPLINGRIRLRLFVDRASIDIFGNDGRLYMPMGMILPGEQLSVAVRAEGEGATLNRLDVHTLKSAWATARQTPDPN